MSPFVNGTASARRGLRHRIATPYTARNCMRPSASRASTPPPADLLDVEQRVLARNAAPLPRASSVTTARTRSRRAARNSPATRRASPAARSGRSRAAGATTGRGAGLRCSIPIRSASLRCGRRRPTGSPPTGSADRSCETDRVRRQPSRRTKFRKSGRPRAPSKAVTVLSSPSLVWFVQKKARSRARSTV